MLWFLSIFFSIALIGLVRRTVPKYSPASVFTLFWTFQIIGMLLFFSNYLILYYWGILYICACIFIFDSGYILSKTIIKPRPSIQPKIAINETKAKNIYIVMLLLAFFGVAHSIISNGFNLNALFDLQSALDMSHQNSIDRYSGGDESGSVLTRLLGVNELATTFVGGFLIPLFKKKKRVLSYMAILPPIISGLAEGAKMGIITGAFLFIIGMMVSYQLLNREFKINFKKVILFILLSGAFLALMVVTMMFRIGAFDIDAMYVALGRSTSYALAHLPAFDIWFNSYEESLYNLSMGGKTLFGITNFLGIMERQQGLFETMTTVSTDGSVTNVYTYFRIMIEDFGIFGSLIYLFFMGIVCRIIYDNFLQKRHICINCVFVCGIYFFISWSFVTSVYAYTSFIVLLFYLYFIFRLILVKLRYKNMAQ